MSLNTPYIRRDRFTRVDISAALKKIDAMKRNIPEAMEDLQIELANEGADKMREYIETRGVYGMTGRIWNRRFNGRDRSAPGRVDSGKMLDAVGIKIQKGANKTFSIFGWVGEFEEYFRAQEYGFSKGGFRPPIEVPGMFALRDARRYVENILPRLAKKYENRIARGKY